VPEVFHSSGKASSRGGKVANEGFYDRERDVYYLRPTVIYRMDSGGQDVVTVEREDWRAAVVFGS
jgi:hypothetical protein